MLPRLKWQTSGSARPSADAAALMLYVALNFTAEVETDDQGKRLGRASVSYAELEHITGLSRALISTGLKRLVEFGLIASTGSDQKRGYVIPWASNRWFKLPCRAILSDGKIRPFQQLSLRGKRELHALKLYLYLASIRDNRLPFSMASHEKIHKRLGIPEGEIRRAHSLLTSIGFLAGIDSEFQGIEKVNEPNKYYLTGFQSLIVKEIQQAV
ncbi:hypothetical protein [Bradyrhizobium sp. SZCCHNRI1003]|uniref:hypothetical protein n=1 Tax=Bradyrhizobium sp. SZCCHNRI1003 TaxID=3057275 RepID=UPI0029168C4C|nr:hypothetical protein [Bradyrhizobium sp. SZCCHNRI1003]